MKGLEKKKSPRENRFRFFTDVEMLPISESPLFDLPRSSPYHFHFLLLRHARSFQASRPRAARPSEHRRSSVRGRDATAARATTYAAGVSAAGATAGARFDRTRSSWHSGARMTHAASSLVCGPGSRRVWVGGRLNPFNRRRLPSPEKLESASAESPQSSKRPAARRHPTAIVSSPSSAPLYHSSSHSVVSSSVFIRTQYYNNKPVCARLYVPTPFSYILCRKYTQSCIRITFRVGGAFKRMLGIRLL